MRWNMIGTAAIATALAGAAQASVLWDQSAIDYSSPISMANWLTTGFGTTEAYGMSDITVPAGQTWTVQSITVYMGTYAFSTPSQAVLNYFPKVGSLPLSTNNPRRTTNGGSGQLIAATSTYVDANVMTVTSSMNITLTAGDWWIGLAPKFGSGNDTANQWPAVSHYGNSQAYRTYAPLSNWGDNAADLSAPSTDGAILIQGTVTPAPASLALLGLGGLVAGRRRR